VNKKYKRKRISKNDENYQNENINDQMAHLHTLFVLCNSVCYFFVCFFRTSFFFSRLKDYRSAKEEEVEKAFGAFTFANHHHKHNCMNEMKMFYCANIKGEKKKIHNRL
jgi:hypothetical protein